MLSKCTEGVCVCVHSAGHAEVSAPAADGESASGRADQNPDHEEGATAAAERAALCTIHTR